MSLYGLLDELSDASVHRSLSDLTPLLTDSDFRGRVVVGGDLNTTTAWREPSLRRRDQGVLDRFEALGLVDLLREKREPGPLAGCTCGLGERCEHTWTRLGRGKAPIQTDYLFASRDLVTRLKTCEALSPPDWREYSDHAPIIATFE
nr:hypothetical protein [Actinomycetota bacterium]